MCFVLLLLLLVLNPLHGAPQGEQLGLPPFVLPPCGWSTGFMAIPRTLGRMPRQRLYPALAMTLLRFWGLETEPIVARQTIGNNLSSPGKSKCINSQQPDALYMQHACGCFQQM